MQDGNDGRTDAARPETTRAARLVLVGLAVMSAISAVLVQVLAGPRGIPPDTARLVSTAFIIASALDVLVLAAWARLFGRDG